MSNYDGSICPYCQKEIQPGQRVHICPDCNIPHHEACWNQNGGCTTFGCSEEGGYIDDEEDWSSDNGMQMNYQATPTVPQQAPNSYVSPVSSNYRTNTASTVTSNSRVKKVTSVSSSDTLGGSTRCPNCGAILSPGQEFCHKCGSAANVSSLRKCSNCGASLTDDQEFCPKCGKRFNSLSKKKNSATINSYNDNISKRNSTKRKRIIIISTIIIIIAVLGIGGVLLFSRLGVDSITLSRSSIELRSDGSQVLTAKVMPESATSKKISWKSSDESVAKVTEDGKVKAVGDGTCEITATVGGKSATAKVTVKSGADFRSIYNECCSSAYASVASDGSYLQIDTNPHDLDDFDSTEALASIYAVHEKLGLPDSVLNKMLSTSAMDGRQEDKVGDVSVSWRYHPDRGLEVMYENK